MIGLQLLQGTGVVVVPEKGEGEWNAEGLASCGPFVCD
jgi:hypothetical protein